MNQLIFVKIQLELLFLLLITVFIIIGSLVLKKSNTPDTPAFNHDFTKDFLVKDAETPEGFHLFESGTKKYTILFRKITTCQMVLII
jgi:hypothetical protein